MTRKSILAAIGLAVLAVLAVVTVWTLLPERSNETPSGGPPTEIAFQLPWLHAGAFAGYYAADQNGDYAEEGLAVRFLEGGGEVDPIASVLEGRAQIGLANAIHLFQARAEGKPVRAVAAIHQINPVLFVTLEGSGVDHPRQFAGKTIRSSVANKPILDATLARFGIAPEAYEVVQTYDYGRFYSGEIDVWVGFHFYAENRMTKDGHAVRLMYPDNYGIHFYRDCIFATEQFIAEHPDVITGFLRATLKQGWPRAIRNPETAGQMTAVYKPEVTQAFESDLMTAMLPLISKGDGPIGAMKPEVWAAMSDDLVRIGVLETANDPTQIYTLRFLEEIHGSGG